MAQLEIARAAIVAAQPAVLQQAIGGTAVGTGLNSHAKFGQRVAERIAAETGLVTFGAAGGNFELNVDKPLIAHNVLQSIRLLADGMASFYAH